MSERIVVYAGTRNIYHNMTVAAKSLLRTTRVDRVWFLIEDDTFPEPLPDVIRVKNVSGQRWFDPDGPNARKRWSWMALMKLALPELFLEYERILWLDVDTIIHRDIGNLFTVKLDDCCLAAVEEPMRSKRPFMYFNTGVMIMDLQKMRGTVAEDLIRLANGYPMDFPDQDAINMRLQGQIKPIHPTYNSNYWIVEVDNPTITHFAADRNYERNPAWIEHDRKEWRVL